MWTEILPPDFLTRFGFLFLGKFDFSNRLVKRKLHDRYFEVTLAIICVPFTDASSNFGMRALGGLSQGNCISKQGQEPGEVGIVPTGSLELCRAGSLCCILLP